MTKAEILAALPHLSSEDLAEIQAKLDELTASRWEDRGELTKGDKSALAAALADYDTSPNAGTPWDQARARIKSKLRP